jgi:hypothetical protein
LLFSYQGGIEMVMSRFRSIGRYILLEVQIGQRLVEPLGGREVDRGPQDAGAVDILDIFRTRALQDQS